MMMMMMKTKPTSNNKDDGSVAVVPQFFTPFTGRVINPTAPENKNNRNTKTNKIEPHLFPTSSSTNKDNLSVPIKLTATTSTTTSATASTSTKASSTTSMIHSKDDVNAGCDDEDSDYGCFDSDSDDDDSCTDYDSDDEDDSDCGSLLGGGENAQLFIHKFMAQSKPPASLQRTSSLPSNMSAMYTLTNAVSNTGTLGGRQKATAPKDNEQLQRAATEASLKRISSCQLFVSDQMKTFLLTRQSMDFSTIDVSSHTQGTKSLENIVPPSNKSTTVQQPPQQTVLLSSPPPKHPADTLQEILNKSATTSSSPFVSCQSVCSTFLEITNEMIEAYDAELLSAVRRGDLSAVQDYYYSTKNNTSCCLQCCNKFGESIVHLVARRGNFELLQFLLTTAHVNARVLCDNGRTPLHDACWTTQPKFELIELLLFGGNGSLDNTDFLLVQDNRGWSPLQYAPQTTWNQWNDFLQRHTSSIIRQAAALAKNLQQNHPLGRYKEQRDTSIWLFL